MSSKDFERGLLELLKLRQEEASLEKKLETTRKRQKELLQEWPQMGNVLGIINKVGKPKEKVEAKESGAGLAEVTTLMDNITLRKLDITLTEKSPSAPKSALKRPAKTASAEVPPKQTVKRRLAAKIAVKPKEKSDLILSSREANRRS